VGVIGGLALTLALARAIFQERLATPAVIGGLAAALLPGLVLGLAAGAPLGRHAFGEISGVALGVAVVQALVTLAGGAVGLALAKAIIAYRRWRRI
jgi:hypothetical protein